MEVEQTDAWKAFLELRKKKERMFPFTDLAKGRILVKLRAFKKEGMDPEEILWQSVERGWTGVFPVKAQDKPGKLLGVPSQDAEKTLAYLEQKAQERVKAPSHILRQLQELRMRIAR